MRFPPVGTGGSRSATNQRKLTAGVGYGWRNRSGVVPSTQDDYVLYRNEIMTFKEVAMEAVREYFRPLKSPMFWLCAIVIAIVLHLFWPELFVGICDIADWLVGIK